MCPRKWFSLGALLILAVTQTLMVNAIPAHSNRNVSAAASADLSLLFPDLSDDLRVDFFHLGIINKGPDIAQNVVLRFLVPEGTGFDSIHCSVQSTCTLPPTFGTGEILCAIGDLPPSGRVSTTIVLSINASPGTRIPVQAHVSSDTADVNLDDNVISSNFVVPGFPRVDSVRVLKNPFRIELTGQNLVVPQFGGSGIGIGCDCTPWPFDLARTVTTGVVVIEGGSVLKSQFPKDTPTHICYFDPFRGTTIKTTFTR
jgi:Domain of unknown function DUF11